MPSPGWKEDRIKAQVTQPGFCRNQMPEAHLVRRLGMEKIRVWEGKPEQREEGSD